MYEIISSIKFPHLNIKTNKQTIKQAKKLSPFVGKSSSHGIMKKFLYNKESRFSPNLFVQSPNMQRYGSLKRKKKI